MQLLRLLEYGYKPLLLGYRCCRGALPKGRLSARAGKVADTFAALSTLLQQPKPPNR